MEFTPAGHENEEPHALQESMFGHEAEFPGPENPEDPEDLADLERDDYSEPSLGEAREWEAGEMTHLHAEEAVQAAEAPLASPAGFSHAAPPAGESGIVAGTGPITIGDFAALEDRVLRAVHLVRRERQARLAAEQNAETLQGRVLALESELSQSQDFSAQLDQLQLEIQALRGEREQVRQRVERLLGQLDALEI